jgi:hypothetical protein
MPRTNYTQVEIDTALLTLCLTGRNSIEACRRLKVEGIEINPRTLRSWRLHTHAKRFAEIERQHAPEIERQMIGQARAIVTAANEGTLEAIDAAREQIKNGEAKDPSTVARNLAVTAGVNVDKSLTLEGRPTVIHGATTLDGNIRRLAQQLGFDIDTTAEEMDELPPG